MNPNNPNEPVFPSSQEGSFPPPESSNLGFGQEKAASAAKPVPETSVPSQNLVPPPLPVVENTQPKPESSTPAPMPPPPPPPPPMQSAVVGGSQPRKGLPKILIIIVLLLVVVGALALLLPRLLSRGGATSGEITWWGLWEGAETYQPLIAEYEAENPGIKIKYEQKAKEDYRERLSNALASGDGPDIMTIHNTWVPMFRNSLSTIPTSVMTAQEFAETYYPIMVSDMSLGSGLAGFPTGYDGLGFFINDEIFSNFGKTPPTTWNELRETAKELTIRENDIIRQSGVALGNARNVDHWPEILGLLMTQNGVDLKNPTGELAEQVLTFYTQFQVADRVWDETLPSSTVAFANGNVAMMFAPSWRVHEIKALSPSLRFRVLPVPQLEKLTPEEPDTTYASYWVSAVNDQSPLKEASWKFAKFISSQESLEKIYASARQTREFGQPYPIVSMRDMVSQDPFVSGFLSLAGGARSWYLASRTWDGATGINSKINKYFEDAINAAASNRGGSDVGGLLETVSLGVNQALSDYGLATPRPTPAN